MKRLALTKTRLLAVLLGVALGADFVRGVVATDPTPSPEIQIDEELRCELLHMKEVDQEARFVAIKTGIDLNAPGAPCTTGCGVN